jgi:hypothetical protein
MNGGVKMKGKNDGGVKIKKGENNEGAKVKGKK